MRSKIQTRYGLAKCKFHNTNQSLSRGHWVWLDLYMDLHVPTKFELFALHPSILGVNQSNTFFSPISPFQILNFFVCQSTQTVNSSRGSLCCHSRISPFWVIPITISISNPVVRFSASRTHPSDVHWFATQTSGPTAAISTLTTPTATTTTMSIQLRQPERCQLECTACLGHPESTGAAVAQAVTVC